MKLVKSHLIFSRSQRAGILLLIVLIVAQLSVYHFVDFSEETVFDTSSDEIQLLLRQMDSLNMIHVESRKPKLYPFNPNYITDFKAYTLGMSPEEFDRLKEYREKDNWINSIEDFKRVTDVSDSLLTIISPYFKFPDWIKNSATKTNRNERLKYDERYTEKTYEQKIDLNTATQLQLEEVSGIGKVLSERIIAYRDKIGGFSNDIQLYNVWGLDGAVVQRTLTLFTVKSPKEIKKINVNTASASDIATIPGISFEMAKHIWEYRRLHDNIQSYSEFEKIEGISQEKLRLIQLYLSFD